MSYQRPTNDRGEHLNGSTAWLEDQLAMGWTEINFIDVKAELEYREMEAAYAAALSTPKDAELRFSDQTVAKFEKIRNLEFDAQEAKNCAGLWLNWFQKQQRAKSAEKAQQKLYKALEELSADEMKAYDTWRKATQD